MGRGSRLATAVAALTAVVSLLGLTGGASSPGVAADPGAAAVLSATAVPGAGDVPVRPVSPRPWPGQLGTVACGGFLGLTALNPPAQVMAGRYAIPGFAPYRVAGRAGVDWRADPYRNVSWRMFLHTLAWTGGLIESYERTGERRHLDRAAAIARDWLNRHGPMRRVARDGNPGAVEAAAHRLTTLICLGRHHRAPWLAAAIEDHAGYLARPAHWSGPWNHGTDESVILLSAGCLTGNRAHADLAYRRLLDAVFSPPGAGMRPAIDAQGASNEGSTAYSEYNRSRWAAAIRVMDGCGYPVPAELRRRHALLAEFLAHQVTPQGTGLQLGESEEIDFARLRAVQGSGPLEYAATGGRRGTPPRDRIAAYDAGYLFARSGWGATGRSARDHTLVSARYGAARYAHGQNDQLALTYYAGGGNLLVDAGHHGYNDKAWRQWLASPAAHNTVVPDGVALDPRRAAVLARLERRPGADFFALADAPAPGVRRDRSVLVSYGPDAMLVLDRVRLNTARPVRQLWHLDPRFPAATTTGTTATAVAGRSRVHLVSIPLPGDRLPRGACTAVRGQRQPRQGWVAPRANTVRPATVVSMVRTGRDVRLLTLIAPTGSAGTVGAQVHAEQRGWYRIEATVGGARLTVRVSPGGSLVRG